MLPELAKITRVELEEAVDGEILKRALIEAGEDLGYKAKARDDAETLYQMDPVQGTEKYERTIVKLSKGGFPMLSASIDCHHRNLLFS